MQPQASSPAAAPQYQVEADPPPTHAEPAFPLALPNLDQLPDSAFVRHPVGAAQADTPTVRYNTVRHPSDVLVKTYRMDEGKIFKDMSWCGRIPEGCNVTTKTASLWQEVQA